MRIANPNLKQLHSKSKSVTFVNDFTLGEENNMNEFAIPLKLNLFSPSYETYDYLSFP